MKFLFRGNRINKNDVWLRQFPDNKPTWKNCTFLFDEDCTDYDWLVVYDDLPPLQTERFSKRKEVLKCNPENTLLVTSEPSTIKVYGSKYVRQFNHVLTTQEPWVINHKNAIYSQCGYRWFYGIGSNHVKNWNDIFSSISINKNKTISTMCSDKKQKNTVHSQRYAFTQNLKQAVPELDIFGHGVHLIDDKADAIDAYKYHVVIENISSKDHWSEKLADAFLGHSMPFYYGCTNVEDYFPSGSYISINPYDEACSIKIIKDALHNHAYEDRIDKIKEARDLVLHEYNFFAVVTNLINEHPTNYKPETMGKPHVIRSRHAIRRANPVNFIQYFIERYYVKIRHLVTNKK